jgi:hypothetical protein
MTSLPGRTQSHYLVIILYSETVSQAHEGWDGAGGVR